MNNTRNLYTRLHNFISGSQSKVSVSGAGKYQTNCFYRINFSHFQEILYLNSDSKIIANLPIKIIKFRDCH